MAEPGKPTKPVDLPEKADLVSPDKLWRGVVSVEVRNYAPAPVYVWGPSRTRQEFMAECDINAIMARYEATGDFPISPNGERVPKYVDFVSLPDNLQDYMQMMHDAEESFMRLPATVRYRFENDAFAFVQFASDPANHAQLVEWELAPPDVTPSLGGVVEPAAPASEVEAPPVPPNV